jgi:SAM-dependent methyltransferase
MINFAGSLRRLLKVKSHQFGSQHGRDRLQFGNLRRLAPISRAFGKDRGLPIDRYYIERFLADWAQDIRGHVLEIGDDVYTNKFASDRVSTSDVLHMIEGNPKATIVADLTCADHIEPESFDCIILTQTMQFIYNVQAALRTLHRILKPGGTLLATFGGISQISRWDMDRWGHYWNFTTVSAQRLFEETFPGARIRVQSRGNVLTAIAFMEGLATEELREDELLYDDPGYQLIIVVRAEKSHKPRDDRSETLFQKHSATDRRRLSSTQTSRR